MWKEKGRLFIWCLVLFLGVGCQKKTPAQQQHPDQHSVLATPAPSMSVGMDKSHTEIRDTKTGKIAYVIENEKIDMTPSKTNALTTNLQGNVAILYKDGVPVTRLEAKHVQAEEKSGQVVATGGVVATSLQQTQAKQTLKADTMRWDVSKHLLTGEKNVVFNQEGILNFPCDRFEADTTIDTVTTYTDK
jgi:uncharacterized protein YcfL